MRREPTGAQIVQVILARALGGIPAPRLGAATAALAAAFATGSAALTGQSAHGVFRRLLGAAGVIGLVAWFGQAKVCVSSRIRTGTISPLLLEPPLQILRVADPRSSGLAARAQRGLTSVRPVRTSGCVMKLYQSNKCESCPGNCRSTPVAIATAGKGNRPAEAGETGGCFRQSANQRAVT